MSYVFLCYYYYYHHHHNGMNWDPCSEGLVRSTCMYMYICTPSVFQINVQPNSASTSSTSASVQSVVGYFSETLRKTVSKQRICQNVLFVWEGCRIFETSLLKFHTKFVINEAFIVPNLKALIWMRRFIYQSGILIIQCSTKVSCLVLSKSLLVTLIIGSFMGQNVTAFLEELDDVPMCTEDTSHFSNCH